MYEACPHISCIVCFQKQKLNDPVHRQEILNDLRQVAPDLILNGIYSREGAIEDLLFELKGVPAIAMEGDLANITEEERQRTNPLYTRLIPASRPAGDLELNHHRDFLAALGISAPDLKPVMWLTENDTAAADAFFAAHELDPSRTIALVPGAQHDVKVYPRYLEAMQGLTDYRFLVLGGEKDARLCETMAAKLPNHPVNAVGHTSLRELAAIIGRCRLYVGADTGAAHFACALGVPNVVVLGGGGFVRFFPYSPLTSIVSLPLACLGCGWQCTYTHPHCIKDLPVEPLVAAIRQTLASASDKPRIFVPSSDAWQPQGHAPAAADITQFIPSTAAHLIVVPSKPVKTMMKQPNANSGRQSALFSQIKTPAPAVVATNGHASANGHNGKNGHNGHNGHAASNGHAGPTATLAESFMTVADAHFARGDYKSCLTSLQWALEAKPQDPKILALLANVHFCDGNYQSACRAFHQAVEFDPDNASLHAQLAAACLKTNDLAGARASLEQALHLDANCLDALHLLANLHLQQNRFEDAAALYSRLLTAQPNNVECLLALGKCLYRTGDHAGSRCAYECVVVLDPANAIAAEALQILGAKTNGVAQPAAHARRAPAENRNQSANGPALLSRQAVNGSVRSSCVRPALEEESQRNQEEVNWWKKFIFQFFDKNPEVSEKKFLDRFRSECGTRWKYICDGLNLDINCCSEGAVLDVGNGPCGLINFVPARIKVGVDPNNELYQRHDILYNVHNDVVLLPARAEAIPLLDHTFDFVTCVNVLDHTNDPVAILNEIHRLLKPGGIFWLSVDTRKPEETQLVHPHAISEEIVTEWASAFECIVCRTDQRCYDEHPINKRLDIWFQKPVAETGRLPAALPRSASAPRDLAQNQALAVPPVAPAVVRSWPYDLWFQTGLSEAVSCGGFFEDITEGLYSLILRPGDITMDCGANAGRHTFPMRRIIGENGLMIAVEAIPDLAHSLDKKLESENFADVIIINMALGKEVGETNFNHVTGLDGWSGIAQRQDLPEWARGTVKTIQVPMVTLDRIVADLKVPSVRFIKMDIEGGEYHALQGATQLMNSAQPPVIVFENGRQSSADLYQYSPADWFALFARANYQVFDLFGRPFNRQAWSQDGIPWYAIAAKRPEDIQLIQTRLPELIAPLQAKWEQLAQAPATK